MKTNTITHSKHSKLNRLLLFFAIIAAIFHAGHASSMAADAIRPSTRLSDPSPSVDDRSYCVQSMVRIARPVLASLAKGELKASIPPSPKERESFACLEAFGRTFAGIAPWLELGSDESAEGRLRSEFIQMTIKAVSKAVDPTSPDYMKFDADVTADDYKTFRNRQPLVDTAFLAHGLLRSQKQIWSKLSEKDRKNVISALKSSRCIKPGMSNWLLFSGMIEAALWEFTGECNIDPIETAISNHLEWFKGDGTYGDGPNFHWDYYNSFVIQPMLLDICKVCSDKKHPLGKHYGTVLSRIIRYAEVQERFISPEGTFPVMGRSSVYRFAAFQALSQVALMNKLPSKMSKGAVRAGLTAVIKRMLEMPGTFDSNGWLRPGVVGFQPKLKEDYISAGSLYLCTVGLLHLGLPANDKFWTAEQEPWTQKKIWSGSPDIEEQAVR